jgi:hypothetical protein
MKKTFYDVLWALCENDGLIEKWIDEGLLINSKSKFSWHPKVSFILKENELKIVGELTVNDNKTTNMSVPKGKTPKIYPDIPWLVDYSEKFSRKNIGFSGKVSDNKSTLEKMHKFLEKYDFTPEEILAATDMYIESMKRAASVKFIRNSGYFIFKVIDGVLQSDLASWCEEYRNTGSKGNYNSRGII